MSLAAWFKPHGADNLQLRAPSREGGKARKMVAVTARQGMSQGDDFQKNKAASDIQANA